MIIRKPTKLKEYKLSYLYTHEYYNKKKNSLLFQNITTDYEIQKKNKLNRNSDVNLTEPKYKNDKNSKKSLKINLKLNAFSIRNSINNIFMPRESYIYFRNKAIEKNKNIFNRKKYINKNYEFLPILKGTKEKKYSLSLFEKEKKKQRDKYEQKLREKLYELEACEKKFDVEIYNTLYKLNEEEKKLSKLNNI